MTAWEAQVQVQTFLCIGSFCSPLLSAEPVTKYFSVIRQHTEAVEPNGAALADTPAEDQDLPFAQAAQAREPV